MDLVSLGFLIVMVLAGGLVALMADKLGRTLGKKRLTLFGLRPRHTATVITVAAGMFLPFVTVLFVAAVSKDVRTWIVEGRKAAEDRDAARAEVTKLEGEKTGLETHIAGLKKENDEAVKRLAAQTKQFRAQTAKLALLQKQMSGLSLQIRTLQSSVQLAQYKVRIANADLANATKARTIAVRSLQAANVQLASTRRSYFELKRQVAEQYNQNNLLTSQNATLDANNKRLTKDNSDLEDEKKKSAAQLEFARLQYDNAVTRLNEVRQTLDNAAEQVRLYQQYLEANFDVSRGQPIIVEIGDELARVSVPAHTSAADAKAIYGSLMKQVLAVATAKGAKAHPEEQTGPDPASLIPKHDAQGQLIDVSAPIINSITDQDEDKVLVATGLANTFKGEWIPLKIEAKSNPLVYKRDSRVATVTVNGSETEPIIIQRVSDFLANVVRPKAIKDQMIPVTGKEDQFGAVSLSDIVQISHTIMDAGRPVTLSVFATADTRAADPLLLRFRVR